MWSWDTIVLRHDQTCWTYDGHQTCYNHFAGGGGNLGGYNTHDLRKSQKQLQAKYRRSTTMKQPNKLKLNVRKLRTRMNKRRSR